MDTHPFFNANERLGQMMEKREGLLTHFVLPPAMKDISTRSHDPGGSSSLFCVLDISTRLAVMV
jgi:hypothetical protein